MSGGQNRNDTKRKKIDCLRERRIRHRLWENAFNIHILCPDSYRSRWSGIAFHSLLQRCFAPRKVVHLPSLYSRMTGRYLIPFCKKLFYLSAHTCPFRRLRRHLSQGKASHTLLQRRSAPRKVVRLLPVIRGRLKTCMLSFSFHKAGNAFCMIHFVIFVFTHIYFCSFVT